MTRRKNIDDYIFQEKTQKQFRDDVALLRKYISIPPTEISNPVDYLEKITGIFHQLYPFYTLSVFLPGPWRKQFITIHGKEGKKILTIIFKNREYSEGVLKLCDDFFQKWISPMMKKQNYPANYMKLLSVEEVKDFIVKGELPKRYILEKRARGYIYFSGKIIPIRNFEKFLAKKNLYIEKIEKTASEFKGVVACKGGFIRGRVKSIFNSQEATFFRKGDILVTPMTSPEYLSAMKKAKAIVTDEGGLTCHAAIVSRELNKPCIIGTKIATKVLKDGNLIEVDADKGIVRKL